MNIYDLTMEQIITYRTWLSEEEKSAGTIEKYLRDIYGFFHWLNGEAVSKERALDWKAYLLERGYAPVTINSMLSAVNSLLHFLGWDDCRVKFLKIQRRLFREEQRVLTRTEYECLLETARSLGRERLVLLMETICATGIRVSGSTLYHRGIRAKGTGGNHTERENPNHPDSEQAVPEAAEIRQKAKDHLR